MRFYSLLLCFIVIISLPATAQDKIYRRNGEVIEGKVKQVKPSTVIYNKLDTSDKRDRFISKAEVLKIEYENKVVEYFGTTTLAITPKKNKERLLYNKVKESGYGLNILSPQVVVCELGSGLGFAYERVLDRKGLWSFLFPLAVVHKDGAESLEFEEWGYTKFIMQLMPGVKFYPFGNSGHVRYATGLQLSYQRGARQEETKLPPTPWGYNPEGWVYLDILKVGPVLHNSINFYPVPAFYIGIDTGLGFTLVNKKENLVFGSMVEQGTAPITQAALKMGYRF